MERPTRGRAARALGAVALAVALALPGAGRGGEESPTPADRALADRVAIRLAASPSLRDADLEVVARRGAIRLSGVVEDEGDRERAVGIVRRTRGVEAVEADLRIDPDLARPEVEVSDEQLAQRVARELVDTVFPGAQTRQEGRYAWKVAGDEWAFDVEADEGHVRLVGTVAFAGDPGRAVRTAEVVPGVRAVQEDLAVDAER